MTDKTAHKCSRYFSWEELCDLEEAAYDMAVSVVPTQEFKGLVRITVEYIPEDK